MNFADLIGQTDLINRLKRIFSSGRIAHAYLFTGPRGVGKKTITDIFARALICESKYNKPCDLCRPCRQYNSGNHPDVFRIKPLGASTGIEQIRNMQSDIAVLPYQADKKIYIIEEAHTMTVQAQNALLKTLEEPPTFVVIFLISENIESMLPAVLSRCQILNVGRISRAEVRQIIEKRTGLSPQEADVFAGLAEGLPGKGLELATSEGFKTLRSKVFDFVERLGEGEACEIFNYRDFFLECKDLIDDIMDILVLWFRDLLVYHQTKDENLVVNSDKISLIKRQADMFKLEVIYSILKKMEYYKKMLKSNTNYQITIDNMLLALQGSD